MPELRHSGRLVFFQAENWEERHSAWRAHRVPTQRAVNASGMLGA